jgi:hypothetical protein
MSNKITYTTDVAHCSEIIIVKSYFPAGVFLCDQEDVEKLDCKVKLNLTV